MEMEPEPPARRPDLEGPEAILDRIRDHREWDEPRRHREFDLLIARFDPDRLAEAVRARLARLHGHDGEAVLRLIDALATPDLLDELAEALIAQPDLPAERSWEALSLLDEAGLLDDHPELAGRWEELNEAIDEEGALDALVAQLEDDPDEVWVALQGLGAVEADLRGPIIRGLARREAGPGLLAFLRLLAHAHDPETQAAALEALGDRVSDDPRIVPTWAALAAEHADPAVHDLARRQLGDRPDDAIGALDRPAPRLRRSLVTALDGRGRGTIALAAESSGRWCSAAFLCDVQAGVLGVLGQAGRGPLAVGDAFADLTSLPDIDAIEGADALALGLLSGSLLLCGPSTTPALRYWIEQTAGPSIRPRPFAGPVVESDPEAASTEEVAEMAGAVLASCRTWVDDSDLTYELAEEVALREGDAPPDPIRDAGAYRFLFEHRLQDRLELYRRMLIWMASFWQAAGGPSLSRSALVLAWQLSDPQHAVPGHPFAQALTTQSLLAAQANLVRGIDLRNPTLRAARERGHPDGSG